MEENANAIKKISEGNKDDSWIKGTKKTRKKLTKDNKSASRKYKLGILIKKNTITK